MTEAAEIIRAAAPGGIRLGMVLGSGLGGMAEELTEATRFDFADLPGFPVSGVTGHAGALTVGLLEGTPAAILSGRKHYYEAGDAAAMRTPLETFKALGAEFAFLTNAAGSTREEMGPGSLMTLTDHINFSGRDPLIGVEGDDRFTSMVDAYDERLRWRLKFWAEEESIALHEGVYAWFSGPSFETPAEINAIRILGADAVGMSTAPETIICRHIDLKVVAVSCITNYAAGMTGDALSHEETKSEAAKAEATFRQLIRAFVGSLSDA
ncbi:MAG: purine-nucleoside phosphorylase [Pseudomonadota bacterium]